MTDSTHLYSLITLFLSSTAIGIVAFRLVLKGIYFVETRSTKQQTKEILKEAQSQARSILQSSSTKLEEQITMLREEAEEDLLNQKEMEKEFQKEEALLDEKEEQLTLDEKKFENYELTSEKIQQNIKSSQDQLEGLKAKELHIKDQSIHQLSEKSQINRQETLERLVTGINEENYREGQKALKNIAENLDSQSQKRANRLLSRVLHKYSPEFVWPKSSYFIELEDRTRVDELTQNDSSLLQNLEELSGIHLQLSQEDEEEEGNQRNKILRLSGGFGIYKQAMKDALEVALTSKKLKYNQIESLYQQKRRALEKKLKYLARKLWTS